MKESSKDCKEIWTEFAPRRKELNWNGKSFSYGVSFNNNRTRGEFEYICGVTCNNDISIPEGMKKISIKKGRCLSVYVPSFSQMPQAYNFIFSEYNRTHPEHAIDMSADIIEKYNESYPEKNHLYICFYLK